MSLVEVSKAFPPVKDFLAAGKKKARRQAHRVGMNANNQFQAVKPFVNQYKTPLKAAGLVGAGVAAGGAGGYMMSKSDSLVELSKKLSPEKLAQAKARAKRNGRPYPNAYDNMISGGAKFGKSDLVELSKSWKGEKGDKRNTKYAAAAGGTGFAVGTGLAAVPSYRRIDRVAAKRGNQAMAQRLQGLDGSRKIPGFKENFQQNLKAQFSTPGFKRKEIVRSAGAIAGAGAGAGALATYRRNKANTKVTKAGMRGTKDMTSNMQSEVDRRLGSPRNDVARLKRKYKKAGMSALSGPRTFIPKV